MTLPASLPLPEYENKSNPLWVLESRDLVYGIWYLESEIPAMIQIGSKSMAGPAYFSHFGVSACC